jgi:bifunctional aspartokinase / homoserine dehydrogenase 1
MYTAVCYALCTQALESLGITTHLGMQAAHGQTVTALVPQARAAAAATALAAEFRLEAADGEVEPAAVLQPVTMLSLVEEGLREVTT